jgi:hypothetical protein
MNYTIYIRGMSCAVHTGGMNYAVHTRGMNHTVHARGHSGLVVLVHLVVLVVIFNFFSLFLQFVLLQRIVDIYVCIKKKEFFVASDSRATTWRIGLLETHFGKNASSNSKYLES